MGSSSEESDEIMYEEEDEAVWDDEDEHISDGAANPSNRNQPFRVLSGEELVQAQQSEIVQVSEILNVPLKVAGALLRTVQWNKEALLAKWYDEDKVLHEAVGDAQTQSATPKAEPGSIALCKICYCEENTDLMTALACGHYFCKECYGQFLTHKVMEEGMQCVFATCPEEKCRVICDDDHYKKLVDGPTFKKYSLYLTRSFVDDNPNVVWCPAPGCSYAIELENSRAQEDLKCLCGAMFCSLCTKEPHRPCSCTELREWQAKTSKDGESASWLVTNTKDCPKCFSPIEKNGGCNHMTCKKCQFNFCWLCSMPYKDHKECNRYKEDNNEQGSSGKQKSDKRKELERFTFFLTRYNEHEKSRKLERRILERAEAKMQVLQDENNQSYLETTYVSEAAHVLLECRQILMYSYVKAYYLDPHSSAKGLFEMLQSSLESSVEKLSGHLEADASDDDRIGVINLTRHCQVQLENILR